MDSTATAKAMAKAQSAFTLAASLAASAVVARTFLNDFLPYEVQDFVRSSLSSLLSRFSSASPDLTIVIDHPTYSYETNEIYTAAEAYIGSKVSTTTTRLRVTKQVNDKAIIVTIDDGEEVLDVFQGTHFRWKLVSYSRDKDDGQREAKRFELTFPRQHKELALGKYLTHVLDHWNAIKDGERSLNLHMLHYGSWTSTNLDHPATFDTVAMESELKRMVVEDLDRFVKRKDYYRRVGKAWKRGYLLYGPPGTGKSSLIAAMANHLKFDIYDLELTEVSDNTSLRTILVATANRSILVVEDVDCTIKLQNREEDAEDEGKERVTLSGVLNFIDGLWSSCGDERIIVLTTNHKEKLDPALLRPGRMDMHIHMSYCTTGAFRTLVRNYHCVEEHALFGTIERMLEEEVDVTPAEVTGELMRSDDVDVALQYLVELMEEKKTDPKRRKGGSSSQNESSSCESNVEQQNDGEVKAEKSHCLAVVNDSTAIKDVNDAETCIM